LFFLRADLSAAGCFAPNNNIWLPAILRLLPTYGRWVLNACVEATTIEKQTSKEQETRQQPAGNCQHQVSNARQVFRLSICPAALSAAYK